jgi:hypothetical protein
MFSASSVQSVKTPGVSIMSVFVPMSSKASKSASKTEAFAAGYGADTAAQSAPAATKVPSAPATAKVQSFKAFISRIPAHECNIRSKVVMMTVEIAAKIMEVWNSTNRPLSLGLAKLYANEYLRGQWKLNGEPWIMSEDAEGGEHCVSLQHRAKGLLLAAAEVAKHPDEWPDAQLEIPTVVIYGVEHDTADTVDIGKTRKHSDVLFRDPWVDAILPAEWNTLAGRKAWTTTLAGAARLVWLIEGGATVSSAPKFLISEMMTFIRERHPELCKFVTMVLNANKNDGGNKGLKMSLSYIAALLYVACVVETKDGIMEIDSEKYDKAMLFVDNMAVGGSLEKGSVQWALTGYWNQLTAQKGSKDRDTEWAGPFVKAFRLFLAGVKDVTVNQVKLTAKERDSYSTDPVLFEGWHTLCFERSAQAVVERQKQIELDKAQAAEAAEAAKVVAEQNRAAKKAILDQAKKAKADAEKAVAAAEAELNGGAPKPPRSSKKGAAAAVAAPEAGASAAPVTGQIVPEAVLPTPGKPAASKPAASKKAGKAASKKA